MLGFFSSRKNWDPPLPHPQASVSPPFGSGGRGGTLACGRGGSQFRRRDRYCGTPGIYVLCGEKYRLCRICTFDFRRLQIQNPPTLHHSFNVNQLTRQHTCLFVPLCCRDTKLGVIRQKRYEKTEQMLINSSRYVNNQIIRTFKYGCRNTLSFVMVYSALFHNVLKL